MIYNWLSEILLCSNQMFNKLSGIFPLNGDILSTLQINVLHPFFTIICKSVSHFYVSSHFYRLPNMKTDGF